MKIPKMTAHTSLSEATQQYTTLSSRTRTRTSSVEPQSQSQILAASITDLAARFDRALDNTWKATIYIVPGKITATASESTNQAHKNDNGSLEYVVGENDLELLSIHSSPEEGTGLGSIMVLAFARQANKQDKQQVKVSGPVAPTAHDFYTLMGFQTDPNDPGFEVANGLEEPHKSRTLATLSMIGDTRHVLQQAQASVNRRWTLTAQTNLW